MVYVIGIVGFILGFFAGQALLLVLLKNRSNEELLSNKKLRLKYGIINWASAALGAYAFVKLYQLYFPF